MIKDRIVSMIYTFRYNYGWIFFLIGYLLGAIAMLYVLESGGII